MKKHKQKYLALILACAMALPCFAGIAMAEEKAVDDVVEEEPANIDDPVAMGDFLGKDMPSIVMQASSAKATEAIVKNMADYLKKQGWSLNPAWKASVGSASSKEDLDIALLYDTEDTLKANYAKEKEANKKAKLPGYTYFQDGITTAWIETELDGYSYQFTMKYEWKNNKARLLGGYISITSGYGDVLLLQPLNSKAATLRKNAKTQAAKVEKANKATPIDSLAALDFPGGRKLSAKISADFANIFAQEGWKNMQKTQFYTDPSISKGNIIKDSEKATAKAATRAIGDLQEYKEISEEQNHESPADGRLNYAEKKYTIASGSYYVDFCIEVASYVGGNPDTWEKKNVTNIFLVVKPAKKNAAGSLERFIYPADTKSTVIAADMADYFKGNSPSHAMS